MSEKIYVQKCNCKESTFRDGGKLLKLNFHADTLVEFVKANTNSKGYITFDITQRKEVGKFGETHCVTLNTWVPNSGGGSGRASDSPAGQQTAAQRLLAERRAGGQKAAAPMPVDDDDDSNDAPF